MEHQSSKHRWKCNGRNPMCAECGTYQKHGINDYDYCEEKMAKQDMGISKLCSDHIRMLHNMKASHAREIVAAFFGHKSHAAYLAVRGISINYGLMKQRLQEIEGCEHLDASLIFSQLSIFLKKYG